MSHSLKANELSGILVSGTPTTGDVLTATSATAANWQAASGGLSGSGTAGKLAKWSGTSTLTDSVITESSGLLSIAGTLDFPSVGNNNDANIKFGGGGANGAEFYWTDAPTVVRIDVNNNSILRLTNARAFFDSGIDATSIRVGGVLLDSSHLSDVATLIKTTTSLGGDLSGNLPNATVAKLGTSGTSVTVNTAAPPTTGQVLTATSATAANWQTPSGGSGGGYATVVVAAPSGSASTDTTNIQNAINSASSAGGGVVVLREGLYLINATLTIASKVTIRGQGKAVFGTGSATTIKCDNAMTNTLPLINNTTATDFRLEDLSIDFNVGGRGAGANTDFTVQGLRFSMSRVSLFNTRSQGGTAINILSNSTTDMAHRSFHQCDFYVGTLTVDWMRASGKFTACYWEGLTASSGLTNALCNFQSAAVIGCRFRTTTDYVNATVTLGALGGSGTIPSTLTGCIFEQPSGTATRAVRVSNTANVSAAVVGNVASTTSCGSIDVQAGVTAAATIVGNAGFSAYNNGTQSGNA